MNADKNGTWWIPVDKPCPIVFANDKGWDVVARKRQKTTMALNHALAYRTADECNAWCSKHPDFISKKFLREGGIWTPAR